MSGIREALEAAADELDGGTSDSEGTAPAAAAESSASPDSGDTRPVEASAVADADAVPGGAEGERTAAERARDPKGRFAHKGDKAPTPAVAAKPAAPVANTPVEAGKAPPAAAVTPAAPGLKAPQSWRPAAREAWAKVPAEVQAEVDKREREAATGLQEAAQARKFAQDFQATVRPYEAMIRAEGGNYLAAVDNFFQTAHALRTAPPQHKAQIVANIIKSYGVPIQELDNLLSGQAPQQGQGQPGAQYQDPRVDQLLSTIEEAKQQRQLGIAQRAQSEIEAFKPQAEFITDAKVRGRMSLLLSDAAQRGEAMTLQEAYDTACWSEKEIRGILQQRDAAKAANASQASTQRARAAASSIKGNPAGSSTPQPSGIRGALEAAAERLSGR